MRSITDASSMTALNRNRPPQQTLIEQVVIPEVMMIIRAHQQASPGTMPTEAQVRAAPNFDVDGGNTPAQAFLSATEPAH